MEWSIPTRKRRKNSVRRSQQKTPSLKECKGSIMRRSFNLATKIISWRHSVYTEVCSNRVVSCEYGIFDRSLKVQAGSTDSFSHGKYFTLRHSSKCYVSICSLRYIFVLQNVCTFASYTSLPIYIKTYRSQVI